MEQTENKRFKIYSGLQTPDGTILHSSHRHDYVTHEDKNGKTYILDGGTDYVRCSANGDEVLIECWSDEPFEKIRQYCYRLGYGKVGAEDYGTLRTTFLKDMTDEHLEALLSYCEPNNRFLPFYLQEIEYRKCNVGSIYSDKPKT
jgi:hypothetical protein